MDCKCEGEVSITAATHKHSRHGLDKSPGRTIRHEMTERVMNKLMRGIKTAAGPINQSNCVCNDIGAICNNGQEQRAGGA